MKNWQGISNACLILGEVIVPRDDIMLAFSTKLLNYIITFATPGKSRHCKTFDGLPRGFLFATLIKIFCQV